MSGAEGVAVGVVGLGADEEEDEEAGAIDMLAMEYTNSGS